MSAQALLGIAIFLIVYVIISIDLINKTVAALGGAALFMLLGIISEPKAFAGVDWNVIFLLLGMMIIVGISKKSGIYQYVAIKIARVARGEPLRILALLSLVTAIFSTMLDNVTTILIITPVSMLIAAELEISPIPFLISEAIASNVGGTATLVGDPPNIIIGSAAHLNFLDFAVNLGPFILPLVVIDIGLLFLLFRRQLHASEERKARIIELDESKSIQDRRLLFKSLLVMIAVLIGFIMESFVNLRSSTVALSGAVLLMLLTGGREIDPSFAEIEWGSIFFFIGLFILVGGLVELGIIRKLGVLLLGLTRNNVKTMSIFVLFASGIVSAIVDNIPYVATMTPLVRHVGSVLGETAVLPVWWSLSLGACLGGNATLVGASANVITAGMARKNGFVISFMEFTKYGALVTVINLLLSFAYIMLRYY